MGCIADRARELTIYPIMEEEQPGSLFRCMSWLEELLAAPDREKIGRSGILFWWDRLIITRKRTISLARTPLAEQILITVRKGCSINGILYEIISGNIPKCLVNGDDDGESPRLLVVCTSSAESPLLSDMSLWQDQLIVVNDDSVEELIKQSILLAPSNTEILYIIPRALQEKYDLRILLPLGGVDR